MFSLPEPSDPQVLGSAQMGMNPFSGFVLILALKIRENSPKSDEDGTKAQHVERFCSLDPEELVPWSWINNVLVSFVFTPDINSLVQ